MVNNKVDKKQQAANEFVRYLSKDTSHLPSHDWECQIADTLKDMAVKYEELSSPSAKYAPEWHDYFVKGLRKFLRELPSSTIDLEDAIYALEWEEDAAKIRTDKTPKAPAPHQNSNQNANRKRQAENQAEVKMTAATNTEVGAQDRPAKRVKHDEAQNAKTSSGFTVETEGSMSLILRTSDDTSTSTINLNDHGPAIVTVNVQKKVITASASAKNNKGVKEEGTA